MRGTSLAEIIGPWVEKLGLPIYAAEPFTVKGSSHWYTSVRKQTQFFGEVKQAEDWVLTVRDTYVDVRDTSLNWVIGSHQIYAADPEFLVKLEADLRFILDYLEGN